MLNGNRVSKNLISKSRKHRAYLELHRDICISKLRRKAKTMGLRKWFSVNKSTLVSAVIINESAQRIGKMFQRFLQCKREALVLEKIKESFRCPISLEYVSDIGERFIHDRVVFSRPHLVSYLNASKNFLNPVTRTPIHSYDVHRLEDKDLVAMYQDRKRLRGIEVDKIFMFSFLENESKNIFRSLMVEYPRVETCIFSHLVLSFHSNWKRMQAIDPARTVCVIRSLINDADKTFDGCRRTYGMAIGKYYISKAT